MVNRIITIVMIGLVALIIFLPIVLKDKDHYTNTKREQDTEYVFEGVRLIGLKDGKKQWSMQANNMVDQGKNKTLLFGLEKAELYEKGEARYFLTAEFGEYNRQTEDFKLTQNVQITSTTGDFITTDEVQYNNRMRQMVSGDVIVRSDTAALTARKMVVDVENEIFDFIGEVKVNFTIGSRSQEEDGGSKDAE